MDGMYEMVRSRSLQRVMSRHSGAKRGTQAPVSASRASEVAGHSQPGNLSPNPNLIYFEAEGLCCGVLRRNTAVYWPALTESGCPLCSQIRVSADGIANDGSSDINATSQLLRWIIAYVRADVAVLRPDHFTALTGVTA